MLPHEWLLMSRPCCQWSAGKLVTYRKLFLLHHTRVSLPFTISHAVRWSSFQFKFEETFLLIGSCWNDTELSILIFKKFLYVLSLGENSTIVVLKMIAVRTARSQHPNLYKHYKFPLDGMRINVICYEPHTLSLRPFKFFFQQLHWFL